MDYTCCSMLFLLRHALSLSAVYQIFLSNGHGEMLLIGSRFGPIVVRFEKKIRRRKEGGAV